MTRYERNVNQVNADFTAIKNKLIEAGADIPAGTPTAEYAEKVGELYDAGRQAEYDTFWDAFQNYGNRAYYGGAFKYSAFEEIKPKHKIIPTDEGGGYNTFMYCKKLKKIEAKYVDFSQIPRGRYASQGLGYTFCSDTELEEIEDIGLSPSHTYAHTFAWCYKLKTIAKITVDKSTLFDNPFASCNALENITFEGEIGNDIDFHWSTKLTKASITSIINALAGVSTNVDGKTLTLSKEAVDREFRGVSAGDFVTIVNGSGSLEWETLMRTKPNWTITLA